MPERPCHLCEIPAECLDDRDWCNLSRDAKLVHLALLRRWCGQGPDVDLTVSFPIRLIEPELGLSFEAFDFAMSELEAAGFAWYFEPKRPGRKRRFRLTIPSARLVRHG